MNKEELFEVMGDIGGWHVKAGREPLPRKPVWRRRWVRVVAAVLAVVLVGGVLLRPGEGPLVTSAYAIAEARYPEMASYPSDDLEGWKWSSAYDAWRKDVQALDRDSYADGLEGFFAASIGEFLSGTEGENKVYSPLNVYMALAMLAELTDGNSRAQILELLGHDGIETLRQQASDLWSSNYRDDGMVTRVLASSVWLDEGIEYVQETMDRLAETYYASSYRGPMGSDEYNKALQDWLNEQTGGLLEEQAGQIELPYETVLALATTIYFQAGWSSEFNPGKTAEEIFHAVDGDVTADFMHKRYGEGESYYWGDNFSAACERLDDGRMWFILPDEGVGVDELLDDGQVMDFILAGTKWEQQRQVVLNLSVPKFDVTSQIDLTEGLKALGVTDVFDWTVSDFSPMSEQFDQIFVSQAEHDARVVIDEEGVTATAFTVLTMEDQSAQFPPDEEVDFVADRPFLFVITGDDDLPLFVGVVNHP